MDELQERNFERWVAGQSQPFEDIYTAYKTYSKLKGVSANRDVLESALRSQGAQILRFGGRVYVFGARLKGYSSPKLSPIPTCPGIPEAEFMEALTRHGWVGK